MTGNFYHSLSLWGASLLSVRIKMEHSSTRRCILETGYLLYEVFPSFIGVGVAVIPCSQFFDKPVRLLLAIMGERRSFLKMKKQRFQHFPVIIVPVYTPVAKDFIGNTPRNADHFSLDCLGAA